MSKRVMLRSLLCIALVAALAAAYLPAAAQEDAAAGTIVTTERGTVGISAPAAGDVISGTVEIVGTATSTAFNFYKVEYSIDEGVTWVSAGDEVETAVADGTLVEWDTTSVDNGSYWLQAVVVDNTGNWVASPAVAVTVANEAAAEEEVAAEEGVAEEEAAVEEEAAAEEEVAEEVATSWLTTVGSISVGISAPVAAAALEGEVSIEGTATAAPDVFDFYNVEYSIDAGTSWISIDDIHETAVADGELATWDTTTVDDGAYWLRISLVDNTGNYTASSPVAVTVANGEAVAEVVVEEEAAAEAEEAEVVAEEEVAEEAEAEVVEVVTIAITEPAAGAAVSGTLDISGIASLAGFSYYKVEYSVDDVTWVTVDEDYEHETAVTEADVLATWNTTSVPDGEYMLRVVVVDNTGNFTSSALVTVNVAN